MPLTTFSSIRESAAYVASQSERVTINPGPLQTLGAQLRRQHDADVVWDNGSQFSGSPQDTVAYVLALDAVNFGSDMHSVLRGPPDASAYDTLSGNLKRHFDTHGALSASAMAAMDLKTCAEILKQPLDDDNVTQLLAQYVEAWRQLGSFLIDKHEGSAYACVVSANGRALELVNSLSVMPMFHDVATYRGIQVPFLTRAQLTVSDLSHALNKKRPALFSDLGQLTVFANNTVACALTATGVLSFSPSLINLLESGQVLASGSEAETEVRACTIHACEQLLAMLRLDDDRATIQVLDFYLWQHGRDSASGALPPYRARTIFY